MRGMGQRLRNLTPVLIFIALIFFAFCWKGMNNLRWGMAENLNWHVERLSNRYFIEGGEHQKICGIVSSFSAGILSGEKSIFKGFELLRAFENGPLFGALLISSLKLKFVDPANMELSEKAFYAKIFAMFFQGLKSGKVPLTELKKVRDLLIEERYFFSRTTSGIFIPEKIEMMRGTLASKTLSNCLEIMEKAIRGKSLTETPILPSEVLITAIFGSS